MSRLPACQTLLDLFHQSFWTSWEVWYWLDWKAVDIVLELLGLDDQTVRGSVLRHVQHCADKACHAKLSAYEGFAQCHVCLKCAKLDTTEICAICEERSHRDCLDGCVCGDTRFCDPCAKKARADKICPCMESNTTKFRIDFDGGTPLTRQGENL
jgi:hypothetical protein